MPAGLKPWSASTQWPQKLTGLSAPSLLRFLSLVSFVFLACDAAAGPVQNSKRLVNNFPVDLTPLFNWWAKHDGPRPLTSWVRLTGAIVGTNSGAWIVEGKIEEAREAKSSDGSSEAAAGTQKILLRNPPVDDLVEFQRLTNRLAELNKQRGVLKAEADQAKARDQAVTEQQRAARHNRARARVLAGEDKQLKQTESQAKAEQKPLDEEAKEIKNKLAGCPNLDRYVVDCFALDLHFDYAAMPVFDHGRPIK